jgi:Fe-S cluster assembly protein SufD
MAEASAVAERAAVAQGAVTGSGGVAPYVEQFQRLYREHGAGLALDSADAAARAAALAELAAGGFPLRHDEEWAHTPVRAVVEPQYRLQRSTAWPGGLGGVAAALVAGEPVALLTVNGAFTDGMPGSGTRAGSAGSTESGGVTSDGTGAGGGASNGANAGRDGWRHGRAAPVTVVAGVRVAPLADGAATPAAIAFTRPTGNAFTRLARVFGNAAELRLEAAAGEAPVHLVHLTSAGMLSAPRVRIRIAAGARVTLVETFAAADGVPAGDAPALTCADTEIWIGAGAALTYVRVQAAAEGAFDLGSTTVVQERDSELHALSVAVGARLARHTLNVLAAGPGTASRLGGAGVAGGTPARQVIDNHTYLEHAAPSCASRQTYKMVLGGRGHGVFSGRILVRPVAQQTDAFQLNRNLLLDDAVVDTKPQLEIGADDVRCTHGATTGRLNKDQMFYLQTRGIPRPAAGQMLARGFLDEVVGDLPATALRPRLLELLHRRLDRLAWSAPA